MCRSKPARFSKKCAGLGSKKCAGIERLHTFILSSCPKYGQIVCQRDPIDPSACPTIEQMKALDARICGHPISLPAQSSRDLPRMIVLARHDRPNLNHRTWRNLNQIVEICPYKTTFSTSHAIRPEVERNLIAIKITQWPPRCLDLNRDRNLRIAVAWAHAPRQIIDVDPVRIASIHHIGHPNPPSRKYPSKRTSAR